MIVMMRGQAPSVSITSSQSHLDAEISGNLNLMFALTGRGRFK